MTPLEHWSKFGLRFQQISLALSNLNRALVDSRAALERYMQTPYARRQALEEKLGYRVPDFAWKAMEMQRRTFGSGNGRVMRD